MPENLQGRYGRGVMWPFVQDTGGGNGDRTGKVRMPTVDNRVWRTVTDDDNAE